MLIAPELAQKGSWQGTTSNTYYHNRIAKSLIEVDKSTCETSCPLSKSGKFYAKNPLIYSINFAVACAWKKHQAVLKNAQTAAIIKASFNDYKAKSVLLQKLNSNLNFLALSSEK